MSKKLLKVISVMFLFILVLSFSLEVSAEISNENDIKPQATRCGKCNIGYVTEKINKDPARKTFIPAGRCPYNCGRTFQHYRYTQTGIWTSRCGYCDYYESKRVTLHDYCIN